MTYYGTVVDVEISVDELCKNGKPNLNFLLWCMKNGYFIQEEHIDWPWFIDIDIAKLVISKREDWNEKIRKIFDWHCIRWYEVEDPFSKEPLGIEDSIIVEFNVDKLINRNEPYTNFWTYCIRNGYIKENPDGKTYDSTIDMVWLELSENDDNNAIVYEMLNKYGIPMLQKSDLIYEDEV